MITMMNLRYIEYSFFALLYGTSLFARSNAMTDMFIVSKWCYTLLVLSVCVCIIAVIRFYFHSDSGFCKCQSEKIAIFCNIIFLISFFQTLYGLGQWLHCFSSNGNYRITGSFDNPAGFAVSLVTAFPYILYCRNLMTIIIGRRILSLVLFLTVLVILLSGSRSGLIAVIVMCGWMLYKKKSLKSVVELLLAVTVLIFFMVGVYLFKKDSADGRLLIWRCLLNMIKDNLLTGWGWNAFRKYYMDYQAAYFECHPNSTYAILADNIQSPFNEYLSFFLCFGIIGILFLGVALFLLLRFCQYNNLGPIKQTAANALLGIAVFSFFSYPFTYPSVWILFLFSIYVLINDSFLYKAFCRISRTYYIFIVFCAVFLGSKVYQRIHAEYQWEKIAHAPTKNDLSVFVDLYPILGNDPFFLYNYAFAQFSFGNLDESLILALKCRTLWSNYDLELLLGSIYMQKKNYDLAQLHYTKASFMCPCRFIPHYQLFCLYQEQGNERLAYVLAEKIVTKVVKISSIRVKRIKYEAKLYIQKHYRGIEKKYEKQ